MSDDNSRLQQLKAQLASPGIQQLYQKVRRPKSALENDGDERKISDQEGVNHDTEETPAEKADASEIGFLQTFRKTPAYLAALLGAFALVGAALLASGQNLTADAIEQRMKEDLLASLGMVIPPSTYDNDLVKDSYRFTGKGARAARTIYPAKLHDQVAAVAFEVTGQGYGGAILVLMAVDGGGKLMGVRVLQHAETPGLGDKIEASRDDWILSFNTRSLTDPAPAKWAVKKDGGIFDQFSGATITPRAVVNAVKGGLAFFEANKAQLLSPTMGPETGAKSGAGS